MWSQIWTRKRSYYHSRSFAIGIQFLVIYILTTRKLYWRLENTLQNFSTVTNIQNMLGNGASIISQFQITQAGREAFMREFFRQSKEPYTIWREKISNSELEAIVSDIENAVNDRPITYVHSDIGEIEPLTPNKILKLNMNQRMILKPAPFQGATAEELNCTLQRQKDLSEKYRELWVSEYLLSLRESSNEIYDEPFVQRLRVGDIVLVRRPGRARPYWKMGKVLAISHSNKDATLQLPRRRVTNYNLNHLYP